MKRWSQEAVELLKKQSEQSRNDEPVSPGNGIQFGNPNGSLEISVGKIGDPLPQNVVAVNLHGEEEPILQLRIKQRRKGRTII